MATTVERRPTADPSRLASRWRDSSHHRHPSRLQQTSETRPISYISGIVSTTESTLPVRKNEWDEEDFYSERQQGPISSVAERDTLESQGPIASVSKRGTLDSRDMLEQGKQQQRSGEQHQTDENDERRVNSRDCTADWVEKQGGTSMLGNEDFHATPMA